MESGGVFDDLGSHATEVAARPILVREYPEALSLPSPEGSTVAGSDDDAADQLVCSICLQRLGTKGGPASLPCGHNGCIDCLKEAVRASPSCPICRARVSPSLVLQPNLELREALAAADRFRVALLDAKQQLECEKLRAEEAEAAAEAAAAMVVTQNDAANVQRPPHGSAADGSSRSLARTGSFSNPTVSRSGTGRANSSTMRELVKGMVAIVKGRAKCSEEFFYAQPKGGDIADHAGMPVGGSFGADEWSHSTLPAHLSGPYNPTSARYTGGVQPSAPYLGEAADGFGMVWGGGGGGYSIGGRAGGRPRGMREQELWDAVPPVWVPDSHSGCCMVCEESFKPIVRTRHHCRFCGLLLCHACSPRKCLLPPRFLQHEPQRMCDHCFDLLQPLQPRLVASVAASTLPAVHDVMDATAARAWVNSPVGWRMEDEIFKAANSVKAFSMVGRLSPEKTIPSAVLRNAVGLALLTVVKVGAGVCYRAGTGLVLCRLPDGSWSAPSAIATAGVGWGPQVGGEIADLIVVIRSLEAMKAFCGRYHLALGASFSATAGLMGRTMEADVRAAPSGFSACYTYCCSKGAFVGFAWESSLVAMCSDVNQRFYGAPVSATDLLFGRVAPPRAAEPLYSALHHLYTSFDEAVGSGSIEDAMPESPPPPTYDDCRDLGPPFFVDHPSWRTQET